MLQRNQGSCMGEWSWALLMLQDYLVTSSDPSGGLHAVGS